MNEHEYHMMQLADSLFPSGTFGFSGGMESLVKSGHVKDRNDVLRLIRQQIKFQMLPCDVAVFSAVMKAADENDLEAIVYADNLYFSMKLVHEVRTASTRSGKQILQTILRIKDDALARKFLKRVRKGESAGSYPACLAIGAHSLQIPASSGVRMMLYSYCAGSVGSAIRLGLISHIDGQKILAKLALDVNALEPSSDLDGIWQLAPLVEISQMQHEQDEFRMFIT